MSLRHPQECDQAEEPWEWMTAPTRALLRTGGTILRIGKEHFRCKSIEADGEILVVSLTSFRTDKVYEVNLMAGVCSCHDGAAQARRARPCEHMTAVVAALFEVPEEEDDEVDSVGDPYIGWGD